MYKKARCGYNPCSQVTDFVNLPYIVDSFPAPAQVTSEEYRALLVDESIHQRTDLSLDCPTERWPVTGDRLSFVVCPDSKR